MPLIIFFFAMPRCRYALRYDDIAAFFITPMPLMMMPADISPMFTPYATLSLDAATTSLFHYAAIRLFSLCHYMSAADTPPLFFATLMPLRHDIIATLPRAADADTDERYVHYCCRHAIERFAYFHIDYLHDDTPRLLLKFTPPFFVTRSRY